MYNKKLRIFIISLLVTNSIIAQTKQENTGWLLFLNSTKLNDKWGLHLDMQLRTHDNWDGIRNFLFRPGITYYIKPNQNATVGYLLAQTYLKNAAENKTLNEHRIWEQYIVSHKVFTGQISHRLRLEQRFIERDGYSNLFAQRFRYFFRDVQPLKKAENSFTKGPFVALQNELFFNIQNKNKLNGSLFDQNRAYVAIGVRFSKKFDVEAGYMNQTVKGIANNTMNHIAQLAFYTRF